MTGSVAVGSVVVIAHGLLDAPITRPRAGSPTDTAAAIAAVPGGPWSRLQHHFVHIGRHLSFRNTRHACSSMCGVDAAQEVDLYP